MVAAAPALPLALTTLVWEGLVQTPLSSVSGSPSLRTGHVSLRGTLPFIKSLQTQVVPPAAVSPSPLLLCPGLAYCCY